MRREQGAIGSGVALDEIQRITGQLVQYNEVTWKVAYVGRSLVDSFLNAAKARSRERDRLTIGGG
ncbi:hypothetical protein NCCP436_04980 [Pseudomonas sp. NCCP-436]|nr:hypothetical protein NCCP436_04980 [Pseudomonas sp. NCCP-436]